MSCLLVSHDKPEWCREALDSILAQTYQRWECLVFDSGVLFDSGYFAGYESERRFTIIRSPETDELRRAKAMAPWCYNECFRRGIVNGDWVVYLCDDDLFYPNAFQTFIEGATANPLATALYASQDMAVIDRDGRSKLAGERRAFAVAGKCCNGRLLDCQVDYAQIAHKRSVLHRIKGNDKQEWWPEGKESEGHADGIFLEKIGSITPFYPIDIKVSQNRRTPKSLNCPSLV